MKRRLVEGPTNMGAVVAAQIFSWLPAFVYIMFGYQWFGVDPETAAKHGVALLLLSFVVAGLATVWAAGRARGGVRRVSGIGCFFAWLAYGVASLVFLGFFIVVLASTRWTP